MADGLEKLGVETEIISITDDNTYSSLPNADVVHGFHAYRFYRFMQQLEHKPVSYIITLTGTDLNHHLYDDETRQDVLTCLEEAEAIHVFNQEAKQIITKELPGISHKLYMLPQGTSDFSQQNFHVTKEDNTFLFVLPAGIRKVKNIPSAINMLSELYKKDHSIRLWLVGPILEEEEGQVVLDLVEKNKEWIKYIGQVPHEEMGVAYYQADCILNTSISEGQSSAILEAMGHGIPVLVADNQGNASIVSHKKTGFLYANQNEFLDYAEQIMNNIELRQEIGQNAKDYIAKNHSSQHEAEFLLNVYKNSLNQ